MSSARELKYAVARSVVSSSRVDLSWIDASRSETGFVIERATGSGPFAQIGMARTNDTGYTDTTVVAGTVYTYHIAAVNSVGASDWTDTAVVTTPVSNSVPISPNTLVASAATDGTGRIDLTWSDNSNNETGFRLDRASDGLNYTLIATLGANVTSYSDSLAADGTYTYRIRAFNGAGNSVWSNLASATVATAAAQVVEPAPLVVEAAPLVLIDPDPTQMTDFTVVLNEGPAPLNLDAAVTAQPVAALSVTLTGTSGTSAAVEPVAQDLQAGVENGIAPLQVRKRRLDGNIRRNALSLKNNSVVGHVNPRRKHDDNAVAQVVLDGSAA